MLGIILLRTAYGLMASDNIQLLESNQAAKVIPFDPSAELRAGFAQGTPFDRLRVYLVT